MRLVHRFLFIATACLLVFAPSAKAVLLIEEGQPHATIVIADDPSAATEDAVTELNYWLNRIGGTQLPVVPYSRWGGQGAFVAVGVSPLTEKMGWDAAPFAQEEARVFITDEGIGLLGNDVSPFPNISWTGTYYAVLEFVNSELGAKWIWPGAGGEVFQPQSRIDPQPGAWTWIPDLTLLRSVRNGYGSDFGRLSLEALKANFGVSPNAEEWNTLYEDHQLWLKRQRMKYASNVRFGHAFSKWWDMYGAEHPEWFARPPQGLTQHGGHGVKLNLSNPQVQDKIFNDWYTAWQKDPIANRYLNVAPNDSRGFDTRPETRAMDAPQMQALSDKEIYNGSDAVLSDRYVKFWNELSKRVQAVDPQARLATYAYRNYREPPLEEGLMLEPNIVVAYVGGEGYYPDEGYIQPEWDGWAKRGALLSWRPNLLHSGHGMPYDFSRQLFDDFAFLRKRNMLGTDFDSLIGNWYGQGLVYYVLAEQHHRPDATYDELADEYYSAFGPAEADVRAFYAFFADQTLRGADLIRQSGGVARMTWGGWWPGHMRIVPALMTPEVIAEGNRILDGAAQSIADSDDIYAERVALLQRGFTHAQIMAEAFRELNLQDPSLAIDHDKARIALKPLWDYRMANLMDLAQPTALYFFLEQRALGLWNSFLQGSQGSGSGLRTELLEDGWLLREDVANAGMSANWQIQQAGSDWQSGAVGMPWRRALPQLPETNIVWYKLEFEVPELADVGERVRLRFESVDAETRLWINGVEVDERGYPHRGNYDSWTEAFEVDISSAARSGAKNVLVMRVESDQPNGGITGLVTLLVGE